MYTPVCRGSWSQVPPCHSYIHARFTVCFQISPYNGEISLDSKISIGYPLPFVSGPGVIQINPDSTCPRVDGSGMEEEEEEKVSGV